MATRIVDLGSVIGPAGATGPAGAQGEPATINGVNALTLEATAPLTASQTGDTLTLDAKVTAANRALTSDANKRIAVSAVTATELGRLTGVTGNVQTQLNGKAATVTYTASVDTTWTANSSGGYTKTVAVSGIAATDNPIADVVLGNDADANALYLTAWGCITRITTESGSITLYADGDAPTSSFNIQLKIIR